MKNNLTFLRTQTIQQFKASTGNSDIKVMKNPQTGKLFFAATGGEANITGAVSGDSVPENPVISLVEGDEGRFFMIHKEGGSLEAIAML